MAKILIVDDEIGMQLVMKKILSPLGHSILTAMDGGQALGIAKGQQPDLILADIHLQDLDGAGILTALKRINPKTPVIMLSGFGDADIAAELVRQGAIDHIAKPFKIVDLVALVNRALNKPADTAAPGTWKPAVPPSEPAVPFPVTAENEPFPAGAAASAGALPQAAGSLKKIALFAVPAVLLLAAGFFVARHFMNAAPPAADFAIPYANPSGICWDGKNLWVADWTSETVYVHARDAAFSRRSNFKTPGVEPSGLAFDGEFLWVSHAFGQKIYKHRRDASFSAVTSFASPGPSPSGLYFDGKNLWSTDFQQGKVYKHRLDSTLTAVASFDSPAANPCAIFGFDGHLYVADTKTNRIYKVRPGTFSLAGVYTLPGFENQERHLASLAWDGRSLWACSDGVSKVFRYRMKDLAPAKLQ